MKQLRSLTRVAIHQAVSLALELNADTNLNNYWFLLYRYKKINACLHLCVSACGQYERSVSYRVRSHELYDLASPNSETTYINLSCSSSQKICPFLQSVAKAILLTVRPERDFVFRMCN